MMPGGGRVGAVLLNPDWIKPGSVNMITESSQRELQTGFRDHERASRPMPTATAYLVMLIASRMNACTSAS
jgi:hypothetical protein